MDKPPNEYINPIIFDVQTEKPTAGIRTMTFTLSSAGERYGVQMWNPQFVVSSASEREALSEERLLECFADCEICQVFDPETQQARLEFQKDDCHPIVKAARIQFKRLTR